MRAYNPVGWFEIYVDDMKRAKKFYEEVLKVNLSELLNPTPEQPLQMMAFPMHAEDVTGASGALVRMEGFKAGGNSTIVYFICKDCSVEESKIAAAGGKVFKSKMSIGEHGFITLGFDTEGNMFGLHSME